LNNSYFYLLTTPIIQSSRGVTQNYFANDTSITGSLVCSGSSTTIYNSSFLLYNSLIKQLYDISLTALTNDFVAKTTFSNGIKLLNTSSIELNDGTLITQDGLKSISTNTTDISTNKINIAANTTDISTNKINIATNTANIATINSTLSTYKAADYVSDWTFVSTNQYITFTHNLNSGWIIPADTLHSPPDYLEAPQPPLKYVMHFRLNSSSYLHDISNVGLNGNTGYCILIQDQNRWIIRTASTAICQVINNTISGVTTYNSGYIKLYLWKTG
jgi:hypothetical protein